MNVVIIGRGKVGRALFAKLKHRQHTVRLHAARGKWPRVASDVELIVLAVRDDALPNVARRLARHAKPALAAAVVHVAGALGPDVLAPLRGRSAGVGSAHPLVSFASTKRFPDFDGALLLVAGDRVAVSRARRLGRALGCVPRSWPSVSAERYHALAALVSNGAVALAATAAHELVAAGAPAGEVTPALGVLLRTVAENLLKLGLPTALTGPIRRGDAATVAKHLRQFERQGSEITGLYRALGLAQLPLAAAIGEATPAAQRAIRQALSPPAPGRRRV